MQLLHLIIRCIMLLVVAAAAALTPGCQKPQSQADLLLAKVLQAHGTADTLENISTIVFDGRIATREESGTVKLILARQEKLRSTMRYKQRYEDRILIGARGWRDFGTGFQEAAGPSLEAMIFQYNHLSLLMGRFGRRYKITYGERQIDDKVYPVLELSSAAGPPMTVFTDPETGLIQGVEGRITAGGGEVVMGVGYGDYREISGIMLPHRLINFVNGNPIAESRYDTIAVNVQLSPDTFAVKPQDGAW